MENIPVTQGFLSIFQSCVAYFNARLSMICTRNRIVGRVATLRFYTKACLTPTHGKSWLVSSLFRMNPIVFRIFTLELFSSIYNHSRNDVKLCRLWKEREMFWFENNFKIQKNVIWASRFVPKKQLTTPFSEQLSMRNSWRGNEVDCIRKNSK